MNRLRMRREVFAAVLISLLVLACAAGAAVLFGFEDGNAPHAKAGWQPAIAAAATVIGVSAFVAGMWYVGGKVDRQR